MGIVADEGGGGGVEEVLTGAPEGVKKEMPAALGGAAPKPAEGGAAP